MWSKLPEGTEQFTVLLVGGSDGLCDTIRLREVNQHFRHLAEDAARWHLQDRDPSIRIEALKAAILAAENGKHGRITEVLDCMTDSDAAMRLLATTALSYLMDETDLEAPQARAAGLLCFLDNDSEVRHAAKGLLSAVGFGHCSIVHGLSSIVSCRKEAWLRQEAVEALAHLAQRGDTEAFAVVVRALNDPDLDVRREAVAALGDVAPFGDANGTALLCECSTDPDPTVRCALAHASTIISPWGDESMTTALLSLLEDSHYEVRARAVDALGAVAKPSKQEVVEALMACAQDSQERVRSAVQRSLALLALDPPVGQVVLPSPEPIEGLKSQKAAVLRRESTEHKQDLPPSLALLLNSKGFLCMSRSSKILMEGPLPALSVAFDALVAAPDAPVFWRHPRARFVTVTPSSVTQLCQDHAQRSCREVLHFGYEYLADDISSHLRAFALDHVADVLLAELTRCQKVLLTFAKAFWPRAPHVLFVYEPNALGFEASALGAMLGALCAWSGGLLLATQQAMEGGTWERWSLEDVAMGC